MRKTLKTEVLSSSCRSVAPGPKKSNERPGISMPGRQSNYFFQTGSYIPEAINSLGNGLSFGAYRF